MNMIDENGWRIPRVGTISLQIYNLVKEGKRSKEIARIVGTSPTSVGVLKWKMRHPIESNIRQAMEAQHDRH